MGSFIGRRTQNQEMLSGFANLAWENFWSWYEALRDGADAQWTFSAKKDHQSFTFSVALPIFGMNKKCWFFFNSFVIWRCKDDCNKVITSQYFFCVFVNRFFQRKSFSFQLHTVMYEIYLISGSFLGWNNPILGLFMVAKPTLQSTGA